MDKSKLNEWLQLAASIGVILSLIFVGLEIQQSRQIAIADIYQQRAALVVQVQATRFSPEQYRSAFDKFSAGERISDAEERLLDYAANPWFSYLENNHFQYQIGLLSEEQWVASRNTIRPYAHQQQFLDWWEIERSSWRESFALEVDKVIAEELAKE